APRLALGLAWAQRVQLPAAVLLAIACWREAGPASALLVAPWTLLTFLLAGIGMARVLRHGWARPLDRLCGDVALAFSAIGGVWVLFDRAGLRPLQLDPAIVTLTAVHFHYAGFLLPMFAGFVARRMPESRA